MSIKLQLPKLVDVKPRLTVIGVGGAGCNAINNMIAAGLQGVDFVVANTDAQSLAASSAEHRVQLGANLTEGLGAGSKPEIGEAAAEEAIEEIRGHVVGAHMVFIAAGMGGGTGTGAAAVIARAARELGILTVGIVTKPFQFEGARRLRIADAGVQMLRQHVDTLIVIPNQNLFRIANERTTFAEAFVLADQVLYSGIACIVDLVLKEGLINLDFADVRTIMTGMGTAMMGTGEATGERRAILAAEEAIANPLLDDVTLKGARGLLLSITGGRDLTLYEVDEAASRVRQEVDPDANIIVGATFDDNLGDRVRVSIVASGMLRAGEQISPKQQPKPVATVQQGQPQQSPQLSFQAQAQAQVQAQLQAQAHVRQTPTQSAGFIPATANTRPASLDEDMQRRLSEVLQQAQGPVPHSAPLPQNYAEAPLQPQRSQPESWNAPGNVTIEEGFGQFNGQQGRPYQAAPPQRPLQQQPLQPPTHSGFAAAPPVEIRRGGRRMPEVEEFPPVGQREWHAKNVSSESYGGGTVQPRQGLLGRLTGLGRRTQQATGPNQNEPAVRHGNGDNEPPLPLILGRERR